MSRALGWVAIVAIVVLMGTHPGSLAGLVHNFAHMLQRAGDELSAFVRQL